MGIRGNTHKYILHHDRFKTNTHENILHHHRLKTCLAYDPQDTRLTIAMKVAQHICK